MKTRQCILVLVSVLHPVALPETITIDLSFKMTDLPTAGNHGHGMYSLTWNDVVRSGYAYFDLGVKSHALSLERYTIVVAAPIRHLSSVVPSLGQQVGLHLRTLTRLKHPLPTSHLQPPHNPQYTLPVSS